MTTQTDTEKRMLLEAYNVQHDFWRLMASVIGMRDQMLKSERPSVSREAVIRILEMIVELHGRGVYSEDEVVRRQGLLVKLGLTGNFSADDEMEAIRLIRTSGSILRAVSPPAGVRGETASTR